VCQAKYKNWETLSPVERLGRMTRVDPKPTGLIRFNRESGNSKTGPIPTSMSERGTCPPSCSFYAAGCYALYGHVGFFWKSIDDSNSVSWEGFLSNVARLPDGQLWRHNVAGDLQGVGNSVDIKKLLDLACANDGKRGFTFTHKPIETRTERQAVQAANAMGFTVNLSADTLEDADRLADLDVGPVTVVVASDAPHKMRTPKGRFVIVCPAQRREDTTCESCGLCALPKRKAIIAFRAHGQSSRLIPEIVKHKRSNLDCHA